MQQSNVTAEAFAQKITRLLSALGDGWKYDTVRSCASKGAKKVYEVDGGYTISDKAVWLPGSYDTPETALKAFGFSSETLAAAQSRANANNIDGRVTSADLAVVSQTTSPAITREKFVRDWAVSSGLDPKWALLGYVSEEGQVIVAMPCGCSEEECSGWAMVFPDHIADHLWLYAPSDLKDAYSKAIEDSGGRPARKKYIQDWSERNGWEGKWASLGFMTSGGSTLIALPCACGEENCGGWYPVGAEHVDHHLRFSAPDGLLDAYRKALEDAGGVQDREKKE